MLLWDVWVREYRAYGSRRLFLVGRWGVLRLGFRGALAFGFAIV